MAAAFDPMPLPDDTEGRAALLEAHELLSAPAALDHVTTDLGGRRVLDDVTFPVAEGKINVLIGPSGVGKTTCVKHLVGLLQPTYGRALGDGRDVRRMSQRDEKALKDRMSVMLQGPSLFNCGLFGSLDAFENVAFPLRERTDMADAEIRERTSHYLAALGMTARADALPETMSGGELRRVALARALVSRSELVIIDDVESGIDHVRLRGMIDLIAREQLEYRNTYLITTNEPEVARKLADQLVVLRAGRVVERGSATRILRQRDAFGRRLLEGDAGTGLAMLDEVDASEHERAKSRASDYDILISVLFMITCLVASIAWTIYTMSAG